MENNVKLLVLPLNFSNFAQPFDIGIFSPLNKYASQEIEPFVCTNHTQIQKLKWLSAYVKAQEYTFTQLNFKSTWARVGLEPFCLCKLIC
jgi:hypothetical protein